MAHKTGADARAEAERRMEAAMAQVGFSDDIAAWWMAGFEKGAEWARRATKGRASSDS